MRVEKLIERVELGLKEIQRATSLKQAVVEIGRVAVHNHVAGQEADRLRAHRRQQKRERYRGDRTTHYFYFLVELLC